ncbi:MAG: cache domain-containing protein, partial [Nitrospinales bacterium]
MAFKFTIQAKLVSFFLLLSLIPLCIMGVIAFENGQKALKESIGARLKDSAIQTMDKIDRSLSNRIEDIKAWASIGAMQDVAVGDPEGRITEVLIKLKQDYGVYSGIFCVDLNGGIVASSKRETIGQDVSNEAWFQEAVESPGVTIHGLEYSKLAGGFAVIFSIPIIASHDRSQVIGYLSSRFNWSELYEITNSVQVTNEGQNEAGYVLLIDDKGFVISGPGFILAEDEGEDEGEDEEKLSSRNLLSLGYQSAERALRRQSGFLVETSPTGQEMLAGYAGSKGYRDFKGFGWGVVIQHMTSEAFETVTQLRSQFITIGLGVGFVAIIFAVSVSRGISGPIQKLTEAARAISRGDLSRTIHIQSKDEIGTLADTLRRMMRELNRIIELERSNEALLNFVSIASHDLQEPLRKIAVFGDRLKHSASLDERGRDYLERMQRSA